LHFTKEKEMADFRKWILALAILSLFTGLASAQIIGGGGNQQFSCTSTVSNVPIIRSEGETENIGDIVITCSGGTIPPNQANGVANPQATQANIVVTLGQQITSRLLPATGAPNASEALLLIDEPNSGFLAPVPGFGPALGFIPCTTVTTGCAAFITQLPGAPPASNAATPYSVAVNSASVTPAVAAGSPTTTAAPNTFQGLVTGNQVTFFGIPLVPPGTAGNRVFRITNVRVNASGYAPGATVSAQVSIIGVALGGSTVTAGFVNKSLATSVGPNSTFGQCVSQTLAQATVLTFGEEPSTPTAFKTRVDPNVPGQTNGQGSNLVQNVPGHFISAQISESGFTLLNGLNGVNLTGTAGLADYGTRFTAVFNNIPAGARLFVSQYTVNAPSAIGVASGQVAGTTSWAQLVSSETAPDGNGTVPSVTPFGIAASGTGNNNGLATQPTPTATPVSTAAAINVVEITPVSGTSATATWETMADLPTALDTFYFSVYLTYTAAPGTNVPASGTGTVNLRYGPASTATSATTGPIPRFLDTSKAANAIVINVCRTVLLYPFITNQAGFDTGVAIANTSTDPFGTSPQAGTCTLNWYGAAAPATATTTPVIATGTDYALLASVTTPGFQGYMIATCNFQYAHGFAFVSDLGARNLAMGYLPLVIPDPNLNVQGGRSASPAAIAGAGTAEQLNQ
jgi:hypothetical protein